jgi:hypothetical protein
MLDFDQLSNSAPDSAEIPGGTKMTIVLSFQQEDNESTINALELGQFLYYFRAAYVVALDYEQNTSLTASRIDEHFPIFLALLIDGEKTGDLWTRLLPKNVELEFSSISRKEALQIRVDCSTAAWAALKMVIRVATGENCDQTGGFKLPSMACAIRQLRAAFGHVAPMTLPSERRNNNRNALGKIAAGNFSARTKPA